MHHIFAADIGGTHCRLAAFTAVNGLLTLHKSHTVPTAHIPDTAALLQAFITQVAPPPLSAQGNLHAVDMLAVAVAGPICDTMHASTTNAALSLDMHAALQAGCKHSLLCNDFAAQAWACCSPAMTQALPVLQPHNPAFSTVPSHRSNSQNSAPATAPSHNSAADNSLPLGILGAGTGLGTAALYPLGKGKYCVAAAEAGHTAFAFATSPTELVSPDEADSANALTAPTASTGSTEFSEKAYEAFLLRELALPYISAEDVVSGRGLCRLHYFLTGKKLSAAAIAAHHLHQDSPTCRYFARFLGRVCRHWALSTLCKGGLYITGGVAMKNPVLVCCPDFKHSFWDSPVCGDLLRSIPVFLNTNEHSGLWGAATAGMHALQE